MAEAASVPAQDPQSYEALKRVKATETEWAEKLAAAHKELDATLERQRAESESMIKAAQVEADAEKTAAVQTAREAADREAATILEEGKAAADQAATGAGKRPADRKDDILTAVLGQFAAD